MIRLIRSSLMADFQHEFEQIGRMTDEAELEVLLNPDSTIVFSELRQEEFLFLHKILTEFNITSWFPDDSNLYRAIASFPNWQAVDRLIIAGSQGYPELCTELRKVRDGFQKTEWNFPLPQGNLVIREPLIMGVLNVTPDSFSDGGRFFSAEKAYAHAMEMQESGADILDIGAESTRPGSLPVGVEEEWGRLQPVFKKLRHRLHIPVSIDSYKSEIVHRALSEGAQIINDISGLTFDHQMAEIAARADCPVVLMHMKGTPRNMQINPAYHHLMAEIYQFFQRQIEYAHRNSIQKIILDPGIGFGKRIGDNFELLRRLLEFKTFGYPLLVGPSRKSFIGKTLQVDADNRIFGTAATVALAIQNGAKMLRVHDVREIRQVAEITQQVLTYKLF